MERALVTGANSEIGVAICKCLLENNYEVIACCHQNYERIEKIVNPNLQIKTLNLKSEEEIIKLSAHLEVDVLINVAAVYFDCDFKVKEKSDFMECFEVNVVAPFLLAKHLVIRKNIINISSTDGIDTYNVISMDYCASKAALNNLTKTLSLALPEVNVTALALGWVKTSNEINEDYLQQEMQRANQEELIEIDLIVEYMMKILQNHYKSGSIVRIDGVEENVY